MNNMAKPLWLTFLGAAAIFFLFIQISMGYVPPPQCPLNGIWVPYSYPSASISDVVAEPATVGFETIKMVIVQPIGGLLVCDQNPAAFSAWPATVKSVYWSSGAGLSPSLGNCFSGCQWYYNAVNLTPSANGQLPITFQCDISAPQPLYSRTAAATLLTSISVLAPKRLGYWRFNGSFTGEGGQQPRAATCVQNPTDWNYGALLVNCPFDPLHPIYPSLQYKAIENDGSPNATRNQGTIRFWFKPNWSTASGGPGATAKLFEIADGFVGSRLAIMITSNGQAIQFVTTSGYCTIPSTTHFTKAYTWTAGVWHQIVVTYSSASTALYIDGQPAATGAGVTPIATACLTVNVGSAFDGHNQAHGYFDELETFNYPLPTGQIQSDYVSAASLDSDNDGLTNLQEVNGVNGYITDPYNPDTDGDGVIDSVDCVPLNPNRWDCGDPNDTTPPVITLLQPLNAIPQN